MVDFLLRFRGVLPATAEAPKHGCCRRESAALPSILHGQDSACSREQPDLVGRVRWTICLMIPDARRRGLPLPEGCSLGPGTGLRSHAGSGGRAEPGPRLLNGGWWALHPKLVKKWSYSYETENLCQSGPGRTDPRTFGVWPENDRESQASFPKATRGTPVRYCRTPPSNDMIR